MAAAIEQRSGGSSVREFGGGQVLAGDLRIAFLLSGGAPVLVKSLRGLRRAGHNLDTGFRHRYGYLIDVGHRRARHYQQRAQEALAARMGDEGQE